MPFPPETSRERVLSDDALEYEASRERLQSEALARPYLNGQDSQRRYDGTPARHPESGQFVA
jgi:hypothetical protein